MSPATVRPGDVPIGVVREHLEQLRAAGLGKQRIAALSGVHSRRVQVILTGRPSRDGVQRHVRAETAAKLLEVRPDARLVAADRRVDATGTRRRLQALLALGWSRAELARRAGLRHDTVGRAVHADCCAISTARAVHRLYEHLWDQRPTPSSAPERQSVSRALREAARKGWVPPMAWDEEKIDDPHARPVGARIPRLPALERLDELMWLVDAGTPIRDAVRRAGYADIDSARSVAARHGHRAARLTLPPVVVAA